MKLADIQPFILAALEAHAPLNGAPVLAHDGTERRSEEREEALAGAGCALTVSQIDGGNSTDLLSSRTGSLPSGTAVQVISIYVLIEENVSVNRDGQADRCGLAWEELLARVQACLIGSYQDPVNGHPFYLRPGTKAFENRGREDGIQRVAAEFVIENYIGGE